MSTATTAPWQALLRLHLSRQAHSWRGIVLMTVGLTVLFSWEDGFGVDALLQYGSVAAASFMIVPPATIAKARFDGSYRFLGTLPVAPGQHAASWIALCALCALPMSLLMGGMFVRPPLNLPLSLLPGMVLGVLLFTTAAASVLVAVQLRLSPGEGHKGLFATLGVMYGGVMVLDTIVEQGPSLATLSIPLPVLFAAASLVSTLVAVAMLGFATRSIGRSLTFAWTGPDAR